MVEGMTGEYATIKVVDDRDESGWWLAGVRSVQATRDRTTKHERPF